MPKVTICQISQEWEASRALEDSLAAEASMAYLPSLQGPLAEYPREVSQAVILAVGPSSARVEDYRCIPCTLLDEYNAIPSPHHSYSKTDEHSDKSYVRNRLFFPPLHRISNMLSNDSWWRVGAIVRPVRRDSE